MARIRTIKPEFWTSEQVVECSPIARLMFIGMWNFCDDGGNHPASYKTLKMEVFPGDEISLSQIEQYTNELLKNNLIVGYNGGNGREYWHVTGWDHQKIDRPNPKHPEYEFQKIVDHSSNRDRNVGDQSPPEGKVMEGKGREGKVKEEIKEKNNKKENSKNLRDELSDVTDQTYLDFMQLRKAKKAPLTARAIEGLRAEATKAGISLETALIECCQRGWIGFKADWYCNQQALPQRGSPVIPIDRSEYNKQQTALAREKLFGTQQQERDVTNG
ncbi:MAG: hypothetical protein WC107_04515 [Patescibacteria group bacterium]